MLNIDSKVKRITNGFLVTENDSMKQERYFPTLVDYAKYLMLEAMRDKDDYFKEHDADGEEILVRIEFKEI